MSRSTETTSLRIVMQYFRGDVLVCELKCAGASLNLHISRGERGDDGEPAWRIEAHGKLTDSEIVIAESGTTRTAALSAVGNAWNEKGPGLGLEAFDWDAVAVALRTVRAID
jgi:hypothetical protein